MEFQIPASVEQEHRELHQELKRIMGMGGKTGKRAETVERVMRPHFLNEEAYALPPLGLLPDLASGNLHPDMKGIFSLTDHLKADLPHMIEEHLEIVAALDDLIHDAREEGVQEAIRFAEQLQAHARQEEEIGYPAAILVGEYLHLALSRSSTKLSEIDKKL